MRRAHPAAVSVEQNPDQKAWLLAHLPVGSVDAVLGEDCLQLRSNEAGSLDAAEVANG